jgi:hypothetical protein
MQAWQKAPETFLPSSSGCSCGESKIYPLSAGGIKANALANLIAFIAFLLFLIIGLIAVDLLSQTSVM